VRPSAGATHAGKEPAMSTTEPEPAAEDMIFDANLREFAERVGIICGLEQGGQMSAIEAYTQIRAMWKALKRSKKNLRIGRESPH
jgi:hypothetical protein